MNNLVVMKSNIRIDQVPDKSSQTLRRLSDDDLHTFIAGWRVGTADYIAGMRELERRKARPSDIRSWIAIIIAFAALSISAVQAFL